MDSPYPFRSKYRTKNTPRRLHGRLFAGARGLMATRFTTRISVSILAIIAATDELMRAIGPAIALPTEQRNFHSGILVPHAGRRKASARVLPGNGE
ncbi:hypothetical protein GCM10017710_05730 [Arthrobacter ramosus]